MNSISQLDDSTAQCILSTIVSRRRDSLRQVPDTPDLRSALAEEFAVAPGPNSVSPGDLARQALLVLSEDPGTRQAIEAMTEHSPERLEKLFTGAEIPLATAALIALSTQIEISYDKGWEFKLKTKPLSDSALKSLVEKLISYLP